MSDQGIAIERITPGSTWSPELLVRFGNEEYARTFGHLYTAEQLSTYLAGYLNLDTITSWIENGDSIALFVAFSSEREVVGYCLSSCVYTLPFVVDGRTASQCGELRRLYVAPHFCGTGLSSELLRCGVDFLRDRGFEKATFLGVFTENPRARKFYEKHGFAQVGEYSYEMIGVKMTLMQLQ